MGLAAPRYCCCLGSLPTLTDAVSPLVRTKAAKASQQPQLHPEPYRRPHKHVELMSLVLTWSQICLHEPQMLHSCTQQCTLELDKLGLCVLKWSLMPPGSTEVVWWWLHYITFIQKLQINRHQKVLQRRHGVIHLLLFYFCIWNTWVLPFTVVKIKVILHGFYFHLVRICVFASYTRPTYLWCRCANTRITWIHVTVSQILCSQFYVAIVKVFKWS